MELGRQTYVVLAQSRTHAERLAREDSMDRISAVTVSELPVVGAARILRVF